jgi:hypothetical protein
LELGHMFSNLKDWRVEPRRDLGAPLPLLVL